MSNQPSGTEAVVVVIRDGERDEVAKAQFETGDAGAGMIEGMEIFAPFDGLRDNGRDASHIVVATALRFAPPNSLPLEQVIGHHFAVLVR